MATEKTDLSSKGDEQQGQPSSDANNDLAARLKEVERQLAEKDSAIQAKDKELKSKDAEARKLQAAADQRASLLTRLQTQQQQQPRAGAVRPAPPPASQPQGPDPDLLNFANEQAKEATMLREVIKRGLALEDVEGIVFNSSQELMTQLDLLQQKKEIEELRAQLTKSKEEPGEQGSSSPKLDTGGRSVDEAQQQLANTSQFRNKASELKQEKRYQEATWLALRAIRSDPEKRSIVRVRPEEESVE